MNAIWHVRMERLSIANLLGDRTLERGELEYLETWSKHLKRDDQSLQLLESKLRYLLDTGDIPAAENQADQMVALACKTTKPSFLRRAHGWRAVVYREQSLYQKAISDFEIAEHYAENELQLMEIRLDKGMTLVYANRYEEAEKLLLLAIEIGQKHNDINSQGIAWNNLGICYGQQRKSRPAIEAYDRAISLYSQTGYKLGSAMACGNLSEIYLSRGQLDKALELSRQCQKLGAEAEDVISIGLGQDIAGRVMAELEDFQEAADSLKKSFEIFSEVNDAVAQMMCGCHLITCLCCSGRLKEAEECLKQIEGLMSQTDDPTKEHNLVGAKEAILNAGGKYEQARELLEQYFDGLSIQNQNQAALWLKLAELYGRLGNTIKLREMLDRLQTIPQEKLTDLFRVKMYSSGWVQYSGMGLLQEAGIQKNKGLALLEQMSGSYSDRSVWEKYSRKKLVRALLE